MTQENKTGADCIMRKILIITMLCILIVSFASAEIDNIGEFKQNQCIDLIQICEDCTYVNITSINYPNLTRSVNNVAMTKDGTFYNYTFCNTQELGDYIYNTQGDLNGNTAVESYISYCKYC
jgi:uncharacterized protein YxeA